MKPKFFGLQLFRVSMLVCALTIISLTSARPASYDDYIIIKGDAASVDLLRRNVRQVAPELYVGEAADMMLSNSSPQESENMKKMNKNASGKSNEGGFFKSYGSDADGEKGYVKKTFSDGSHGYKNHDTFHKKDGDNYGFEKHEDFGKANGKHKDGSKNKKSSSYMRKSDGDHEGAGSADTYYAENYDGDYTGYSDGDNYSDDGGSENYGSDGDGDSYSYGDSDGQGESYASDGGDESSYENSESYASDSGDDGDY